MRHTQTLVGAAAVCLTERGPVWGEVCVVYTKVCVLYIPKVCLYCFPHQLQAALPTHKHRHPPPHTNTDKPPQTHPPFTSRIPIRNGCIIITSPTASAFPTNTPTYSSPPLSPPSHAAAHPSATPPNTPHPRDDNTPPSSLQCFTSTSFSSTSPSNDRHRWCTAQNTSHTGTAAAIMPSPLAISYNCKDTSASRAATRWVDPKAPGTPRVSPRGL